VRYIPASCIVAASRARTSSLNSSTACRFQHPAVDAKIRLLRPCLDLPGCGGRRWSLERHSIPQPSTSSCAGSSPPWLPGGSSCSGGEMGPNSDLDLLVVMPDCVHRRRIAQAIYLCLLGLGVAKDVVVVTESDVRDHGENPSLVLFPALREGRELYRAA